MELKPEDLRVSTYRSCQPSDWFMTPDNGVKILHVPTGISVSVHSERSQHRNKAIAFERLEKLVARATPLSVGYRINRFIRRHYPEGGENA